MVSFSHRVRKFEGWLSSWRARIMASAFEPGRKRTISNVEGVLPWGQLKRMFGRLLESAAVYRLSSNLRWFGRLSESVAVYRLSEGLSESAAIYRLSSPGAL